MEAARAPRTPGLGLSARVRAAGGVPIRRAADGRLEVLLVHRPKYDDWTFPKGKAEAEETGEETALREVEEETGLRCELGRELPAAFYTDGKGRPKTVRYWEMRPLADEAAPRNEIDEVRWLAPEEAERLLTYEHDVATLRAVEGR